VAERGVREFPSIASLDVDELRMYAARDDEGTEIVNNIRRQPF
jgi:hypothetical protein